MNTLTARATLAALLVSVPLAGAFADGESPDLHAFDRLSNPAVDTLATSSVGPASNTLSLDARIAAAEANLAPSGPGSAHPAEANRLQAEINAIRAAANSEARANGGQLSPAAYQSLNAQLNAIQQQIYALQNG